MYSQIGVSLTIFGKHLYNQFQAVLAIFLKYMHNQIGVGLTTFDKHLYNQFQAALAIFMNYPHNLAAAISSAMQDLSGGRC